MVGGNSFVIDVHCPCVDVDGNADVACCNVMDNDVVPSRVVTDRFSSVCVVSDTSVSFFTATAVDISVNSVADGDATASFVSSTAYRFTAYLSALSTVDGYINT